MTRRDAAGAIAWAAAIAGGQEFFGAWLRAGELHSHTPAGSAPADPHQWSNYQPRFFSPEEFQTLDSFTAILIPTDETPGAQEAYVAPFIDFVVNAAAEYASDLQKKWRRGLGWLQAQSFGQLSPEQQVAFVTRISEPNADATQNDPGFDTFLLIKEMTVRAFYTSRVGLVEVLEYKGITYLTEFPGCHHPDHHRV